MQGILSAESGQWSEALSGFWKAQAITSWRMDEDYYRRLADILVHVYSTRVAEQPEDMNWQIRLVKYLMDLNRGAEATNLLQALVPKCESLMSGNPTQEVARLCGRAYYYLGRLSEESGAVDAAVNYYQKAIALDEHLIFAYVALLRNYTQSGQTTKVQLLKARLAELRPRYLMSAQFGGSWQPTAIPINDHWKLSGLDFDEMSLEDGSKVQVVLYWLPIGNIPQNLDGSSYIMTDGQVLQIVDLPNLVPNGGFEWDDTLGTMLPSGYNRSFYTDEEFTQHRVETMLRDGTSSRVAVLTADERVPNSSFATNLIPVNEGEIYLAGGEVRTQVTNGQPWLIPSIGGRWIGDVAVEGRVSFVAGNPNIETWTMYAGILKPAQGAKAFQMWLLNNVRKNGAGKSTLIISFCFHYILLMIVLTRRKQVIINDA